MARLFLLVGYAGDSPIGGRIGWSLNQDKHAGAPVTGRRESTRLRGPELDPPGVSIGTTAS